MEGRFTDNHEFPPAEEAGTPPEDDPRSAAAAESTKRRRRSLQKRVVTVPISEVDGTRPKGGSGEGAPPSDSWAWRKYGQKPIKGSPYPRGYYRCSSSKGCPARKQVERSREDPTMLVVTYASDHNHAWPIPKNGLHGGGASAATAAASKQPTPLPSPSPDQEEEDLAGRINFIPPDHDTGERFSDLIGEEASRDYYWFSDVGSPSAASPPGSTDDLLLGPITEASADVALVFREECERCGGGDEEEEEMFAGLGELPECSVVFRRSYQMMEEREEGSRRCGLSAAWRRRRVDGDGGGGGDGGWCPINAEGEGRE